MTTWPNHALQRARPDTLVGNRRVPCAGSLSLVVRRHPHVPRFLLLALLAPALICGCASLPTNRVVDIELAPVKADDPSHHSLSVSDATNLFLSVAEHLGYVVDGPHLDPRTPEFIVYGAHPTPGKGVPMVFLTLLADGPRIDFLASMDATMKEFVAAQSDAKLFQDALDQRGVRYTVAVRSSWLGAP